VNITYELDNMFVKGEELIKEFSTKESMFLSLEYFGEILKEIKDLYKTNKFTKIYTEVFEKLASAYSYVLYETLLFELNSEIDKEPKNGNDSILDVEIEDNK
jgi:hypothetical protein